MESLQVMMEAGSAAPAAVQAWMNWMQLVLILLPLVFIRHRGAQLMLAAQVVNFVVAYVVFVSEGLEVTRLFGLGHLFWLVPAWWFWTAVREREQWKPYAIYSAVALATIGISLVFDLRDIAQWIGGSRGPLWP